VYPLKRVSTSPGGWLSRQARVVWIEKIPFIAVTLCFAALNLFIRSENTGGWSPPLTLEQFGLTSRIMQAFYMWAYYVWKPLVPFDLSPVTTQLVRFDPFAMPFIASLTVVCSLTLVLLWQRKRRPVALALWLCHLTLLVPVLGLTEYPHFPADRYSLVVGILLSIGLASWLVRSAAGPGSGLKPAVIMASGTVIVLCAVASYRQTFVWRDNVSIFTHVLAKLAPDDPIRAKTHVRLGDSLRTSGDATTAIKNYEQAASLAPDSSIPHSLIGDTLAETGDLKGAIAAYNRALQIEPTSIVILNDLGVTYGKSGQLDLAIEQFGKILKLKPDHLSAMRNLAFALRLQGKEKEAAEVERRFNKSLGKEGPSSQ
ncbi:MAG TPA: tetratricopeptide repeat protein, partial [Roseimicrobium sp.]|nr:tetratricopeptide repeat protein [Roseimicrobium sp.]